MYILITSFFFSFVTSNGMLRSGRLTGFRITARAGGWAVTGAGRLGKYAFSTATKN